MRERERKERRERRRGVEKGLVRTRRKGGVVDLVGEGQ